MWQSGVWGPLLRAVKSLYNQSRNVVRIASNKSYLFLVHDVFRQGCPLSLVLFIICMDQMGSGLGTTGFHHCFLWMMLSYWLSLTRTFSMCWSILQLCYAAGMRITSSKSETMVLNRKAVVCRFQVRGSPCLKWRNSSILGSCSRMRDGWNVWLTDGAMQQQQYCCRYTDLLRGRSWVQRRDSQFTSQSMFRLSSMVMTDRTRSWLMTDFQVAYFIEMNR